MTRDVNQNNFNYELRFFSAITVVSLLEANWKSQKAKYSKKYMRFMIILLKWNQKNKFNELFALEAEKEENKYQKLEFFRIYLFSFVD